MKLDSNNSCLGLERKIIWIFCPPLHESGKATRPVAAHFTGAAVAVVEFPCPMRFARSTWDQNHNAIGADAAMPIAQTHDLIATELELLRAIINQHKVVAGAVHFGEFQNH